MASRLPGNGRLLLSGWQRVDAEQRLWESGPLGRRWLRLRKLWAGETRPRGRHQE